jgi:hypothetical protein
MEGGIKGRAPLAVALLDVGQAVPLVGQRRERLGQDQKLLRDHAQLALVCTLHVPRRADNIPRVQQRLQAPAQIQIRMRAPFINYGLPAYLSCTARSRLCMF